MITEAHDMSAIVFVSPIHLDGRMETRHSENDGQSESRVDFQSSTERFTKESSSRTIMLTC